VRPLVDALSHDGARVDAALREVPVSRGSADLSTAVAEALRRLETGRNPEREIVILTDGRRRPWRSDEPKRWALLRELHRDLARRTGVAVRIGAIDVRSQDPPNGADGSVGPLEMARGLVPPLQPLTVRTTIANAGPERLTRTAELWLDGRRITGSAQVVGPVPAGGSVPVTFRAEIDRPGSHALAVRLTPGDDPLPANDEAARVVEVIPALPVLLIDGEPGREPLTGETDFLRAALMPSGDAAPPVAASVVRVTDFSADSLRQVKVAVLANADRLNSSQASALTAFVAEGGGLLVVPGDRTDPDSFNQLGFRDGRGWLPARIGPLRGDFAARKPTAHPAPATFHGPSLAPFGQGESPAMGEADLFAYRVLEPAQAPAAAVLARLDSGDPWIVERSYHQGRVAVMAGPLDAEGGTLPVNPDYVPLMHELVYHLGDASSVTSVQPGEPLVVTLDPHLDEATSTIPVTTPSGETALARIVRGKGLPRAELAVTDEPGLYRFQRPGPAGPAYALVAADPRDADASPLSENDRARLVDGWPMIFGRSPDEVTGRLATGREGPRPIWRALVLVALAGLGLEVLLTRRMVRDRGVAEPGED
jgi:hypothetical protein